ncbi:MAG: Salicylate 5-hydroxylase, large oxygenase component, partial [Pseudomonadota bacterium]
MQEHPIRWERTDNSRIPFAVYCNPDSHRQELQRFFYQGHWSYVGLEVEIPNAGDFKRTVIGERSVILTRSQDGQIHVVENVCAHRGMAFCRKRHGNSKELVCPYHQWSYALDGTLQGVPFRRGVRQDGKVHGGMPADFNPQHHGLTRLKVATRGGVVFASFDHDVESLEDFMGPT